MKNQGGSLVDLQYAVPSHHHLALGHALHLNALRTTAIVAFPTTVPRMAMGRSLIANALNTSKSYHLMNASNKIQFCVSYLFNSTPVILIGLS